MKILLSALFMFTSGFAMAGVAVAPAKVAVPKPQSVTSTEPVREWTIMLYMSGKTGVPYGAWDDLTELASVGTTDKVAVIAEIGSSKFADRFKGTKRFVITKGMNVFTAQPEMQQAVVDQGDWKNIANFVAWAKQRAPAKRYMFVFWAHGLGFFDQKKPEPATPSGRGVGLDMTTNNYLTLPELRLFANAAKVDVIAFNACLMGMAEVMYELGSAVPVAVASEQTMPGYGYEYGAFLTGLNRNPGLTPMQAGALLAATSMNFYRANGLNSHAGVLNPSAAAQLLKMLSAWQAAVRQTNDVDALNYANGRAVRFASPFGESLATSPFGDLSDYITLFNARLNMTKPGAQQLKAQGEAIVKFISTSLVLKYYYADAAGGIYSRSKGVAIHLPALHPGVTYELMNSPKYLQVPYAALDFAKDGKWGEFLQWAYSVRSKPVPTAIPAAATK